MIKNIDDTELKQLFKKELPQAPENPWFTRKVMNRLPEKEFKVFSWIEYLSYAIAIVGLVIYWAIFCRDLKEAATITMQDIISYTALTVTGFFIAISFVAPKVKRWLMEL